MARFNNGIMGGFTGIVGHIEGYIRKGQPVMRSRRRKVTKFSDAQLACRQRMKVVNEFTSPITDFVRIGFGVDAAPTTKTASNLAISYQLLHGLKGEYPNLEIDYPKVRVTSGTLEVVQNPTMVLEGSALNFSWENDKIRDNNFEDDQLMILVYYPDRKMASRRYTGAKRGTLKDTIKAYKLKPGERLEAYLSFRSDDRKSISNSVYVGSITGEAILTPPVEALEQELPRVEPEFPQVKLETEPAIESTPAIEAIPITESIPELTFKSKLIAAIEQIVEARSKSVSLFEPKLVLNSVQASEAIIKVSFKSKLIIETVPAVTTEPEVNPKLIIEVTPAVENEPEHKPKLILETAPALQAKRELEMEKFSKPESFKSKARSSNSSKRISRFE
jgi:hypothetical protein